MSTPNGQHPLDPNGASQATSTVLALDGWGPVIPEPPSNGSNGSEPELIVEEAPEAAQQSGNDWRQSLRASLKHQVAKPTIDPQRIRVIAPAATMAIAVVVALRLGSSWRQTTTFAPAPMPPTRVTVLRRRIALLIDPSLTPVEPQRFALLRWLR